MWTNVYKTAYRHRTLLHCQHAQVFGALKDRSHVRCALLDSKKVKISRTRLPSVGFRSWSRFLAVSLQVTWVQHANHSATEPPRNSNSMYFDGGVHTYTLCAMLRCASKNTRSVLPVQRSNAQRMCERPLGGLSRAHYIRRLVQNCVHGGDWKCGSGKCRSKPYGTPTRDYIEKAYSYVVRLVLILLAEESVLVVAIKIVA